MTYFVIYNLNTGRLYKRPDGYPEARYETMRTAKSTVTRLNKKAPETKFVVYEYNDYRAAFPVKMVEKTNLMSGKKYMEAEDTPLCCSPASETYWSM